MFYNRSKIIRNIILRKIAFRPLSLLFFILISFPNSLSASENDYSVVKFTGNSILETSTINTIYQDSLGYLWFGTNQGLVQYNGYDFKIFQHVSGDSTSLGSSQISDIAEDEEGNLWIATKGGGLNKFNRNNNSFEVILYDPSDENSLPDNQINYVEIDKNGAIWLGFTFEGLVRFDPDTRDILQFKMFEGNKENGIDELFLIEDQLFLKFFRGGNYKIDVNNIKDKISINKNLIPVSDEDFEHMLNQSNSLFLQPQSDDLLFKDKSGVIWKGTNKGLYKIYPKLLTTARPIQSKLARNIVNDIELISSGELLIGLWNEGLYKFNQNRKKHYKIDYLSNQNFNIVSLLYEQKTNIVWIGKWDGIVKLDLTNKSMMSTQNRHSIDFYTIMDLYGTEDDNVWIASWGKKDNALFKYNTNNHRMYSYKTGKGALNHVDFSCVIEDFEGVVWAGTSQYGLNKIVEYEDSVAYTSFKLNPNDKHSLSSNSVNTIYEDKKNRLWIGTTDGLCLYDRENENFRIFNETNGFAEDYINSIIEDDDGAIWISTRTNISKFIPETGLVINYYQEDGIEFTFFTPRSVCKDKYGMIYFGGEGGYVSFNPDSLKNIDYIPPVVITGFWLNNSPLQAGKKTEDGRLVLDKDISLTDSLELKYSDNIISLEFAALDYLHPEKIRYKYKLEGFDNVWHYTDANRRFITYTNLDPGDYNLKIVSTNSHGDWNSVPTNLYINISAPFWIQWWFILALSLATFFIILFIQNLRLSSLKRHKQQVERLVESRTQELEASYQNIITLSETGQKINASIEIQDIVNSIYEQLNRLMDASIFAIGLVKKEKAFGIEYFGCRTKEQVCTEFQLPDEDKTIVKQCINLEREFIFNNLVRNDIQQSGIFIPLIKNEVLLGVLIVKCNRKNAYSQLQVNLLKNLAIYIISALENAKSYMKIIKQKKAIEQYAKQEQELHKVKLHYFTEISHEFRTPLTLIKLPIQKLLKSKDMKQNEFQELRLAEKNIEYMLKLINDVIDFEKKDIDATKLHISKKRIKYYLSNIYKTFSGLAEEQRISFQIKLNFSEPSEIWFDKDKLHKVLYNLISNAFKYSPMGGEIIINATLVNYNDSNTQFPEKIISRMKQNPDIKFLIISIEDSGKGIRKEELERIFQRHYHSDSLIRDSSGIGLYLTKKLVENHKGAIDVQSDINKGSKFIFCIPVDYLYFAECVNCEIEDQKEIVSTKEWIQSTVNDENKSDNNRGGMPAQKNILIVEDNKELLNYLVNEFSEYYKVSYAENGRKGIDAAFRVLPDIIISDIMMPEVDGVELCNTLKNDIQTSHIPIILLTAKVAINHQLSGLNAGADDYIAKPFDINVLKLKAYNILKSRLLLQEKFNKEFKLEPSKIAISSFDKLFLEKAINYIEDNMIESKINIDMFAESMNMSRATLYNKINALVGKPVNEFILSIRLKRAAQIFQSGAFSVNEVAYQTGFQAPEHFSRRFKKEFNMSPSEFIKKQGIINN